MTTPELLELQPVLQGNEIESIDSEIKRLAGIDLSYNDFYWRYMQQNRPVLLTGISSKWECRRNWTIKRENEEEKEDKYENYTTEEHNDNRNAAAITTAINFDYLRHKVGNCRVPIADCSREYFNSHLKTEMCFHHFLDHWQAHQRQISDAINSNIMPKQGDGDGDRDNNTTLHSTDGDTSTRNLYLKDWHLKAQMPDYDFYRVPKHFASDWLNEQLLANGQDDYRFVYMGPQDSWTPFHADVFGSYSWSTNIVGCKKWLMLPPGEELKLCDRLGMLPFRIDEQLLEKKHVRFYTVLQGENEALFVPSGWHHQVWNISDTISINHNWFNACNVHRIWLNLNTNMRQVVDEIADCRQMDNFDEHCQTMLRASFGMNYIDFLQLLEGVVERRLKCITPTTTETTKSSSTTQFLLFDNYALNEYHMRYDLSIIRSVVDAMLDDEIICNSRTILYRRCMRLSELTNNG